MGVLLGEYNTYTDPDCENGVCANEAQFVKAKSVAIHRKYDDSSLAHDIVLITMARKVQFNGKFIESKFLIEIIQISFYIQNAIGFAHHIKIDYVLPICLPTGRESEQSSFAEVGKNNFQNLSNRNLSKFQVFNAAGWGAIEIETRAEPTILQYTKVFHFI